MKRHRPPAGGVLLRRGTSTLRVGCSPSAGVRAYVCFLSAGAGSFFVRGAGGGGGSFLGGTIGSFFGGMIGSFFGGGRIEPFLGGDTLAVLLGGGTLSGRSSRASAMSTRIGLAFA